MSTNTLSKVCKTCAFIFSSFPEFLNQNWKFVLNQSLHVYSWIPCLRNKPLINIIKTFSKFNEYYLWYPFQIILKRKMLSFIIAKFTEIFCVHLGTEQNVLHRFFENKIEFVCKLNVNSWHYKTRLLNNFRVWYASRQKYIDIVRSILGKFNCPILDTQLLAAV